MDMMDQLFREPVEVYLAAVGEPTSLAERLRSTVELTSLEREALALLVKGELKPPKLGRGEKRPKYLYHHFESYDLMLLPNAEALYQHIMSKLKKTKRAYGRAHEVLAYVSEHDDIESEKLFNYLRRPKDEKARRKPRLPRGVLQRFHLWLYRTGRLTF